MGTNLIFIGFLFLINPDLITFDVIPDFIGYFLIAKGLSRISLLEERLSSARKYALILALTSILKLLACTVTFSTRIESTRLTVCFVFLVAEVSFSYLLCDNAFKGLQYLAIRKGGDLVLKSYDLVKIFVTAFFMVKAGANFLPQFPVIFFTNIDADADLVENYSQMVSSFRMLRSIFFIVGAVILVILGVYTARILKAYLARCREDSAFSEGIRATYETDVVRNESLQTRLAVKAAFFLFFLAFICLGDLYLDHINMFLRPLFALFIYFGLRKLAPFSTVQKRHIHISLVSFFVTLLCFCYRLICLFTQEDFAYTFPYEPLPIIVAVLNAVFTFIPLVFVLIAVSDCVKKYTSFSYRKFFVALLILCAALVLLSFSQYLFVGRSDLVVTLQWIFYAVTLYLHKSSMDDIFAEVEYKLM